MKIKDLNKMLKVGRFAGQARLQLNQIDKLKLPLALRNKISSQLLGAYEALEFLKLKAEDIVTTHVSKR